MGYLVSMSKTPYMCRTCKSLNRCSALTPKGYKRWWCGDCGSKKPGVVAFASIPMTAAERARESDEQVERDISADLLPVWNRVKRSIKATDRMSRTEAFEHWVHEHSADVYEIQAEALESDVAELVANEYAQRAQMFDLSVPF